MSDEFQYIVTNIPAHRIEDQVAKEVAEKRNLSKDLVDKINRFQWNTVHDGIKNNKSIHVCRFFKLNINRKKAFESTRELITQRMKLTTLIIKGADKGYSTQWKKKIDKKIYDINRKLRKYDDLISGEKTM